MFKLRPFTLAALCAGSLLTAALPVGATTIYTARYSGNTFIGSLDSSGAPKNTTFLNSTSPNPIGLTVDNVNNKIYWWDGGTFIVKSANLDGSGVATLANLSSPSVRGTDLAIDPMGGYLYYAADIGAQIGRIDLTTGAKTTLLNFSQGYGIAVDPNQGKIYFSSDSTGFIGQANLDGTGVNLNYIATGTNGSYGLGIDLVNNKLYWSGATGKIGVANLDGTGINSNLVTVANVRDVTVDLSIGKIFYTNNGNIGIANLDGTGANNSFSTGFTGAWGIAGTSVPEPSAIALSLTGMGALLVLARRKRQ